jgi:flagellar protein FlaG
MVGNAYTVTAVPARTPALSALAAAEAAVASFAAPGNNAAPSGRSLPPPPEPVAAADLEETVRKLNEIMSARQRNLSFHVDEASGRTVITVRDAATKQVVRQIPAEEVLAVSRALEAAGPLIDARA